MKFHWRDIVYVHSAFSHNTHRPARSHRYKNYTVTTDDFARAPKSTVGAYRRAAALVGP